MSEHELVATFAGFHCRCNGWRIGSWNGAQAAFERHVRSVDEKALRSDDTRKAGESDD